MRRLRPYGEVPDPGGRAELILTLRTMQRMGWAGLLMLGVAFASMIAMTYYQVAFDLLFSALIVAGSLKMSYRTLERLKSNQ